MHAINSYTLTAANGKPQVSLIFVFPSVKLLPLVSRIFGSMLLIAPYIERKEKKLIATMLIWFLTSYITVVHFLILISTLSKMNYSSKAVQTPFAWKTHQICVQKFIERHFIPLAMLK